MLCAREPVKCWSRFPNCRGATTRRSTFIPLCVRTFAPALPEASTDCISGSAMNAATSASASFAVAMMSRSLHESAMRRAEPASSTLSEAGCSRSAATMGSPIASARSSTTRGASSPSGVASSAARMFSSAFGPKPFSVRSRSSFAATRRASIESMPRASYSARARLGPSPGSRVISTSPAGNLARSFAVAGISLSSTSARIFSWRVLPTPVSSVARPSRASPATDIEASRTLCAAVRYATTRWTIAPSSSYRSPSSARASAISLFVGSAMVRKEIG